MWPYKLFLIFCSLQKSNVKATRWAVTAMRLGKFVTTCFAVVERQLRMEVHMQIECATGLGLEMCQSLRSL